MFFFDHDRREATRPASLHPVRLRPIQERIDAYFALPDRERRQTDVPPVWKIPFADDVLPALMDLSHGKCAFCERLNVRLQPYRFRPPAYATPSTGADDKDCYLWLAFDWNNIYPICEECLPSNKSFFPVLGARDKRKRTGVPLFNRTNESSLLLLPGDFLYLHSGYDQGVANKLYFNEILDKFRITTTHFNLYRTELNDKRSAAAREMFLAVESNALENWLLMRSISASKNILISQFTKTEFGGYLYILLREFLIRCSGAKYQFRNLGPNTIINFINEMKYENEFKSKMHSVISEILLMAHNNYDESIFSIYVNTISIDIVVPEYFDEVKSFNPTSVHRKEHVPRHHFTGVTIENFKSVAGANLRMPTGARAFDFDPSSEIGEEKVASCLLLLGENAAGKSSILEAIALAAMDPKTRRRLRPDPNRLVYDPVQMGSPDQPRPDRAEITVTFEGEASSRLVLGRIPNRISFKTKLSRDLPLVFAYGARRLFGKSKSLQASDHVATLFDPGKQLPDPIDWLVEVNKRDPQALDEVASALRHIISIDGHFSNIEVRPDGDAWINIWRREGDTAPVPIPLSSASSGYRAVLALVCDIFRGLEEACRASMGENDTPLDFHEVRMSEALVLIDEVEAHLHPRWKMSIIGGLRRALPHVTFILSSHDPLCLRGMLDGEVLVLNRYREGEGETARDAVEVIGKFEGIQYRTIEQLLTSDLFRLLTTDPRSERDLAKVSDMLSSGKRPTEFSKEEQSLLSRFNGEISSALPIGDTPITRLVQEAVAEYLQARESADQGRTKDARDKAKDRIKDFLAGLVQ